MRAVGGHLFSCLVLVIALSSWNTVECVPFTTTLSSLSSSSLLRLSGGSSSSSSITNHHHNDDDYNNDPNIRVAYQGEPGAYSECSLRELLGDNVVAVGRQDFESCYRAVVAREVDYCCLPIENSLGGSIHDNYDLMLRYDLTIVAEHEFRVQHCMLAREGVTRKDIKYAISHPQALAQCDNYFRSMGITPIKAYDTSGSAKMLSQDDFEETFCHLQNADNSGSSNTKEPMTPYNTCAVASDLAGKTYGLNCLQKNMEDDDSNFTRFLLLARKEHSVRQHITKDIPAKTSIVFTLLNAPGALYKALACFSLRDIDFSKIESRPTSATLLNFLKYKAQTTMGVQNNKGGNGNNGNNGSSSSSSSIQDNGELPRFRFCFYLDILTNELDQDAQNALHHLRERADFCRVLGSYPQKSRLVGPVKDRVENLKQMMGSNTQSQSQQQLSITSLPSDLPNTQKLKIGILGFGNFGQFIAHKIVRTTHHSVSCIDPLDKSEAANELNVNYFPMFDMLSFLKNVDVIVLAVPLIDFDNIVSNLPTNLLHNKLILEVCPLNAHPKSVLLSHLPPDTDIICSHPMFGPANAMDRNTNNDSSTTTTTTSELPDWDGLPFVYENVRITNDPKRAQQVLDIFAHARCKMVEMPSHMHDQYTANAEFVTHLTGRLLHSKNLLPPSPIVSPEYSMLQHISKITTSGSSFDLFYGMFKFNEKNAKQSITEVRMRLAKLERQLAAKEAYLAAKAELQNDDRQKLLSECKLLLNEVARHHYMDSSSSTNNNTESKAANTSPTVSTITDTSPEATKTSSVTNSNQKDKKK